jgi:ubiquinone/menaquinone biosynthesis C-methylase UbiE
MTTPINPSNEQPSTYMVQNRSNQDEMKRLQIQDEMLTRSMGGVLSEQSDAASMQRVLDVACGTGGWLIEVAQAYPTIAQLVGVDISARMINNARARAKTQQVSTRVEFRVMDALRGLDFPDAHFDLVNLRLGDSWLRTWDWPALLREFQRVTRPGGILRVTESDMVTDNGSSPSLALFMASFLDALYQSGHYFTPDKNCLLPELAAMFQRSGVQDVQTRAYKLEFRSGTPEGHHLVEDVRHSFQNFLPFLRKWTQVPDNYEAIYQQAIQEMQQPDFLATWNFLTVWGTRPPEAEPPYPAVK